MSARIKSENTVMTSFDIEQSSFASRVEEDEADGQQEVLDFVPKEFRCEVACETVDFRVQTDTVPKFLWYEAYDSEEVRLFVGQQFLLRFDQKAGLKAGWQDVAGVRVVIAPYIKASTGDFRRTNSGELGDPSAQPRMMKTPSNLGRPLLLFVREGGEFRIRFIDARRNIEVYPLNFDSLRRVREPTTERSTRPSRIARQPRKVSSIEDWWKGKAFSKTTFFSNYYLSVYSTYLVVIMLITAVGIWSLEAGKHFEAHNRYIDFSDALYLSVSAGTGFGASSWDFKDTKFATQFLVVIHTMLCSTLLLTAAPLVLRRRSFRFQMRYEMRKGTAIGHAVQAGDFETVEYNALGKLLNYILSYYVLVQVSGFFLIWPLQACRKGRGTGLIGSIWPSFVLASTCFHNTGLTLIDLPFDDTANDPPWIRRCMLPVVAALTLLGNACYPLALRGILRVLHLREKKVDPAIELLLKDPRRCYTHLFPGYATRWLLCVTIALFVFQVVAMYIAESEDYQENYPRSLRYTFIWFHTVATRAAGIALCDLSKLNPAAAFTMSVCMYISISPVVVATRTTQVSDEPEYDIEGNHIHVQEDFTQKRMQLAKFMGNNCIVLVILFFCILHTEADLAQTHFVWMVFEFCSAWGTSGMTMSPKGYAFSGDWSQWGKTFLMIVMFMGRLRGLPHSIDPSVRLSYRPPRRLRARPSVHRNTHLPAIAFSRDIHPAPI